MGLILFIKGVILGFSIAAPVGPMGVLCIRRTLSKGIMNGLLSGLGTATADALYGCIAAFGVTAVSAFLLENQPYLRFIGGIFLLYLGYTTFRSTPSEVAAEVNERDRLGSYSSAFFLTLTNPMTILSFAAVFAGMGVGTTDGNYIHAGILVFGVFTGSTLWWLVLCEMVNVLRSKFDHRRLTLVNKISGFVIAGFGILSLITM